MAESIRNVFRGRVLTLNLEQVRLPNGRVAELEIAHHPGGAAVVAIDPEGYTLEFETFRDDPMNTAIRRLLAAPRPQ